MIEYLNVATRGNWQHKLSKSKVGQYLLGVILGIIPGCLGAYTVVSLYTHGVVSFGSLVAAMIATSGDEAYIMLSLFPVLDNRTRPRLYLVHDLVPSSVSQVFCHLI